MYHKKEEVERRCLPKSELRSDGESGKITGYAAVFDTWTDIGGMFREKILLQVERRTLPGKPGESKRKSKQVERAGRQLLLPDLVD